MNKTTVITIDTQGWQFTRSMELKEARKETGIDRGGRVTSVPDVGYHHSPAVSTERVFQQARQLGIPARDKKETPGGRLRGPYFLR